MKAINILLPVLILLSAACSKHPDDADLMNEDAALPASFNFSKMGLKVISSSINQTRGTMSTLYGNDLALNTTKAGNPVHAGEVLAMITWKQKEDIHWFGARIPGKVLSLEMIKTTGEQAGNIKTHYQRFEGKELVLKTDTTGNDQHIRYILAQQPSVMP
ncbi:MAG: hypothetical protein ABWY16_12490 [Pedobacter sp.]|uniref:hypothetical protein n=1 Tax=Pedobacter sp. TaxID=1411316 RepID=UPI003395978D